jgi:hypothetical protein
MGYCQLKASSIERRTQFFSTTYSHILDSSERASAFNLGIQWIGDLQHHSGRATSFGRRRINIVAWMG